MIFKHSLLYRSLFIFLLLTNYSLAEELNLSDEATAKDLLLNKSLNCWMKETNYNGPIKIETKSIKGKKFYAISKEWCHQTLQWTGKFNKNKMKIVQKGASAQTCYCRSGILTFKKDNNGEIIASGHYGVGCGATPFRGTLECTIK